MRRFVCLFLSLSLSLSRYFFSIVRFADSILLFVFFPYFNFSSPSQLVRQRVNSKSNELWSTLNALSRRSLFRFSPRSSSCRRERVSWPGSVAVNPRNASGGRAGRREKRDEARRTSSPTFVLDQPALSLASFPSRKFFWLEALEYRRYERLAQVGKILPGKIFRSVSRNGASVFTSLARFQGPCFLRSVLSSFLFLRSFFGGCIHLWISSP